MPYGAAYVNDNARFEAEERARYSKMAEKSAAATRCEQEAINKFQEARQQMEKRGDLVAGSKHTVELLQPSCHLTGPCWKSFRKHVLSFEGWVPKRREASEEEMQQLKYRRKGKVYFVDVVYGIPKEKQAMKRSVEAAQGTSKAGSSGTVFGSGGDANPSSEDEAATEQKARFGKWLFACLSGGPIPSPPFSIDSEDEDEAPNAKMAKLDAE